MAMARRCVAGPLAAAIAVAALSAPRRACGQSLSDALNLSGYYLNVATGVLEGPYTPAGVTDFQRLRLMASPDLGPLQFDIAYEQSLELVSDPGLGLGPQLGGNASGINWLPLQWTIEDWDHGSWRHRFDRLFVSAPLGASAEATVGRQTISWATSLILTPADPFAPFDPADPFREYRAGVDALRIQGFASSFTELELVLRPADTPEGTTMTALGRITTASGPWEVSGWAGVLHDGGAASAGATLTAAGTAFRGEAELRWPDDVLRFSIGADRSFSVAGRDLYMVLEYQRDGYGARDPADYAAVLLSAPYQRGELQVIGRNELALQASWQATPLLTPELLAVWNLDDGSLLLTPAASYSLSNEMYVRGGFYFGIGAGRTTEYGVVPSSLYLSLTAFF
jgi:hypothetical protein